MTARCLSNNRNRFHASEAQVSDAEIATTTIPQRTPSTNTMALLFALFRASLLLLSPVVSFVCQGFRSQIQLCKGGVLLSCAMCRLVLKL